jgi:hypothetical protein
MKKIKFQLTPSGWLTTPLSCGRRVQVALVVEFAVGLGDPVGDGPQPPGGRTWMWSRCPQRHPPVFA